MRVKKAIEQIKDSHLPGFIALNLDSRFQRVDPRQPRADMLAEFTEVFNEMNRSADKWATDPQVLGILGFGHAAAWEFPEEGLPRLHTVAPMRWNAVTDHEYQDKFFRRFMEGWSARFRRRMQAIVDGEIQG